MLITAEILLASVVFLGIIYLDAQLLYNYKYLLQEVKTMLRIGWEYPEIPEFDPDIHNPEKVFAFLCYRGIHYANWVYLDIFNQDWKLKNPREEG